MKKGFTLTEILITIVILAVMAGIAIPTFFASRTKNEASQAMTYLRAIRLAEMMRYAKFGNYTTTIADLGVEITSTNYTFVVAVTAGNPAGTPPTPDDFTITATGPGGTIIHDRLGTWSGTYTPLPVA